MRGRGGPPRSRGRGNPDFVMGDGAVTVKTVNAVLQGAAKSGVLKLANRELTSLPPEIFRLDEMDYQDKQWWTEETLHTVDVSHNRLDVLPSDFVSFAESLRCLVASYNAIASVFADFSHFRLLVKLDLSHNRLQGDLASALGGCSGGVQALRELKECDLSHNLLTSASGFAWLPNLTTLQLSHNRLSSFEHAPPPPEAAGMAPYRVLQLLDVSNNSLAELPPLFIGAKNLQTLDASCNRITAVDPAALSPALHTLNLRQNALRELPCPLRCPSLRDLIIGANRFDALPDLSAAAGINFLDASTNKLTSVERAASLQQLVRLDLQNNDLATLPPRLALIKSLNSVILDGNPLRAIRRDIVARGTVELLKYLRTRLGEADNDDIVQSTDALLAQAQRMPPQQPRPASSGMMGDAPPPQNHFQTEAMGYGAPAPVPVAATGGVVRPGRGAAVEAGRPRGGAPAAATGITMLGERQGASWVLSYDARGSAPQLPELLDMALILNGAPATPQVVAGCQTWTLAGQRKLRRIDPEVLGLIAAELREVDLSNTGVDSLDFILAMPVHILGRPSPPALATLVAQGVRLSGPFPMEWCTARTLTRLDLSRNGITALPDPLFANMSALAYVHLNNNQIRQFPMVLLRLPGLLELHLSSNGLQDLPEGPHTAWPQLQALDVSYNDLQTVPFTLGLMQRTLRTIKLEGNRMRWLRQSVLDKGAVKILEFLRDKIA